jgi:hypothetical protein
MSGGVGVAARNTRSCPFAIFKILPIPEPARLCPLPKTLLHMDSLLPESTPMGPVRNTFGPELLISPAGREAHRIHYDEIFVLGCGRMLSHSFRLFAEFGRHYCNRRNSRYDCRSSRLTPSRFVCYTRNFGDSADRFQ